MDDLVRQLEKAFEWSNDSMLSEASEEITALRARLAELEKERDDYRRLMGLERQLADKNAQRAERAEAALATARRVADDAIKMCEDGYPVSAYNVALQVVRALANEAET